MTRQKLSQRLRHDCPTRPRSSTTCSTAACESSWLSESPAWPAPTTTTSTDSGRDEPRDVRAAPPDCDVIGPPHRQGTLPTLTLRDLRSRVVPRLRMGVPRYEILLLGRFVVRVDGQPVPADAWRHRRAAELVKILALADAHRLHSEQVRDLLWPDLPPDAAAGNLRKAVHFARASLGSAAAISRSGEMLELCPEGHLRVDALTFEAAARAGQIGALDAYPGELLPEDRYAAWAEEPRERLRTLYLRLLKTAGLWERVLEVEPADEEAHRALMQRAVDAGDRLAAVRQFARLCEHLRADLGLGPDPTSVALYERATATASPGPPTAAERTRAQ